MKPGKKTKQWNRIRAQLKKEFLTTGITTCEIGLNGCWVDNGLTFAHRMKRRFITDETELKIVVLACIPCHNRLDVEMSHEEMKRAVDAAIERRVNVVQ